MLKKSLTLALLAASLLGLTGFAWGQDSGVPDTFYVEIYPQDQCLSGDPPHFVRFPIYVTHDIVDPYADSIAGIVAPLCYNHSNTAHYCSLSWHWNNANLYPGPDLDRSIFRHYIRGSDTLIHNWFMDQSQKPGDVVWDFRFVDLVDGESRFWLCLVPTGSEDQRMGDASRLLIVTMTFRLEDTTTIRIDTCFWPPGDSRILFANSAAQTYIPVNFLPVTQSVLRSERGDANGDGLIDITDVLYMLNYLFRSGPPPVSFVAGDANSDDDLGVLDPLYLLNYLYKGGPPPLC
jgi:hypothetical protein